MPWQNRHAIKHTRKANTPKRQRAWRKVANSVLANPKYGRTQKQREGAAVRIANFVVNRMANKSAATSQRRKIAARRRPVSRSTSRRKLSGPGRRPGFHHSRATRKKISQALRAHHARRRRSQHKSK